MLSPAYPCCHFSDVYRVQSLESIPQPLQYHPVYTRNTGSKRLSATLNAAALDNARDTSTQNYRRKLLVSRRASASSDHRSSERTLTRALVRTSRPADAALPRSRPLACSGSTTHCIRCRPKDHSLEAASSQQPAASSPSSSSPFAIAPIDAGCASESDNNGSIYPHKLR